MGGRRDDARRSRERAHRARDGAEMGARQRERRDCRAGAPRDGDARPRRQRRDAARRRPGAKCSSSTASRSSTRKASAARGRIVSSTCRSPATARPCASAPPGRRARRATARSRRSSAPSDRPACARRTPARCNTPSDAPKIPAAAIADRRRRSPRSAWRTASSKVVVRLKMEAHFEADAESANVIGEIRGRELPDEVVVVGGHLDSWDVGAGATDDGGGCVVTWEALRLMKKLNLRPRRTVRVVLFTNEENGGRGGHGVSRSASRRAGEARDDAGVGRRRVPAARLRLHRQRRGARHGQGDRHAAERHRRRPGQRRRRRRRHRPERPGRRTSRRCRSTSTARSIS